MRNRKQSGVLRRKVPFVKRRQLLRHSSCPPEEFEAVLKEAIAISAVSSSDEQPSRDSISYETVTVELASVSGARRRKFNQAKPPTVPSSTQSEKDNLHCQQSPQGEAMPAAVVEVDAATSKTAHTLLAIPAVAVAAEATSTKLKGFGMSQCRRQAVQQKVLLSQQRTSADSVDKAEVEQMMNRLSELLRTLHPSASDGLQAVSEVATATGATIAANPLQESRLLAQCGQAHIPDRYRQALRQLIADSRQKRMAAVTEQRRSNWEKKLLYEK